jgi:hypothetical protein
MSVIRWLHEPADVGIRHAVGHRGQTHDGAHQGDGGVAAVEHAQLGLFKRLDVFDHLHAHGRERGAVGGVDEVALHHPLPEGFGAQRAGVVQAGHAGGVGAVLGGGGRNDAVHHAVGKGAGGLYPLRQHGVLRRGGVQAQLPQLAAVAAQVVAGGDGQPAQAGRMARGQACHQLRREPGAVGFFGHGERDPARGGRGDGGGHAFRLTRRDAGVQHGADQLPAPPFGAGDLQGVKPILAGQRIGQPGAAHGHAQHTPARVAGLQQGVKHHGLVGAVECTQAQVQHAGRQGGPRG